MGVDHKLTLAYSKEENAMVENANKGVLEYLRNLMFERRIISKWSIALPLVQRILMTDKNEVTGMTPAQMLYGNSVDLDRGIFLLPNIPADEEGREIRLSERAADMLQTQRDLIVDIATERQKKRDARHVEREREREPTDFPEGTFVLVSYPKTAFEFRHQQSSKSLHDRLRWNRCKDSPPLRNRLARDLEKSGILKDFVKERLLSTRRPTHHMLKRLAIHRKEGGGSIV
eukprot:gene36397-47383_t